MYVVKILFHFLPYLTGTPSYFMQGGQIRESGTHSQLLSKRGAYYRFAQLQQLGNDRPARFSIDLFMKK